MPTKFQYVPTSGDLSGASFEDQTERAFNELGAEIDEFSQVANDASSTAEQALQAAHSAETTASEAEATAQAAQQQVTELEARVDELESTVDGVQETADKALETAENASTLANTASGVATAAQNAATEALSASAEANATANNALVVANSAMSSSSGTSGVYTTVVDEVNADDYWEEAGEYFVTAPKSGSAGDDEGSETQDATNFPISPPLWFRVEITDTGTSVTQTCWPASEDEAPDDEVEEEEGESGENGNGGDDDATDDDSTATDSFGIYTRVGTITQTLTDGEETFEFAVTVTEEEQEEEEPEEEPEDENGDSDGNGDADDDDDADDDEDTEGDEGSEPEPDESITIGVLKVTASESGTLTATFTDGESSGDDEAGGEGNGSSDEIASAEESAEEDGETETPASPITGGFEAKGTVGAYLFGTLTFTFVDDNAEDGESSENQGGAEDQVDADAEDEDDSDETPAAPAFPDCAISVDGESVITVQNGAAYYTNAYATADKATLQFDSIDLTDKTITCGVRILWTDTDEATTTWSEWRSGGGGSAIPSGVIVMWSGEIKDIPSGWALCDGTNNTPDLSGKFVLGAGDEYEVGKFGGSKIPYTTEATVLTDEQMSAHTHQVPVYVGGGEYDRDVNAAYAGFTHADSTISTTSSGEGNSQGHTHTIITRNDDADAEDEASSVADDDADTDDGFLPPYYALAYIMKL